jgi:Flp pilus assembly protein TadG
MRNRKRNQRGTTVVEAALTLVLFMTMLFSMFDFGYTYFMHQTIVHRVRAAARYGALHPANTTAIRNYVVYQRPECGNGTGMFGLEPSDVQVVRTGAGTTADRLNVTVSGYNLFFVTPGQSGSKSGKPITVSIPVEAE